jgi:hypothetical protein
MLATLKKNSELQRILAYSGLRAANPKCPSKIK